MEGSQYIFRLIVSKEALLPNRLCPNWLSHRAKPPGISNLTCHRNIKLIPRIRPSQCTINSKSKPAALHSVTAGSKESLI